MAIELPDNLIMLERSAEEERAKLAGLDGEVYEAQWRQWREASVAVQAAITEHATGTEQSRVKVEMAVKQAVRHVEQDPVE